MSKIKITGTNAQYSIMFSLSFILKMSNLITLVIQEKKSRSNHGRNKKITIVPKIKFQEKNCSQAKKMHCHRKKLPDILSAKSLSVERALQQILKILKSGKYCLRYEPHSTENQSREQSQAYGRSSSICQIYIRKCSSKDRNMIETVRMQNSKWRCLEVLRTFKYQDDSTRTKDYIDWTKMAEYHPIRAKCSVI